MLNYLGCYYTALTWDYCSCVEENDVKGLTEKEKNIYYQGRLDAMMKEKSRIAGLYLFQNEKSILNGQPLSILGSAICNDYCIEGDVILQCAKKGYYLKNFDGDMYKYKWSNQNVIFSKDQPMDEKVVYNSLKEKVKKFNSEKNIEQNKYKNKNRLNDDEFRTF